MAWIYALAGAAVGAAAWLSFHLIPASWFCDFGEKAGKKHIKPKIPFITAAVFAAAPVLIFPRLFGAYGFTLKTFTISIAYIFIIQCCLSDMVFGIIPTQLCIVLSFLSLFTLDGFTPAALLSLLGSGLIPAAGFFLLGALGRLFYKTEALGFGDVYFALSLGFFLSISNSWMIFLLCMLISGFTFAILKAFGLYKEKYAALGPYIAAAFTVVVCYDAPLRGLLDWYISLITR